MRFSVIFSLAFAVVAVLFALQNATPVTVAFLSWKFEGSLALVLLLTLILGLLIGVSLYLPSTIRKSRTIAELKQRIGELERRTVAQKEPREFPPTERLP